MIKKILHQSMAVPNLEEAIKLYKELGFEEGKSFEKENGKAKATYVKLGDFALEIWQFMDESSEFFPLKDHIGVEVDSLEETISEMEKLGGTLLMPITPGTTVKQYAFIKNSDGKVFELVEK